MIIRGFVRAVPRRSLTCEVRGIWPPQQSRHYTGSAFLSLRRTRVARVNLARNSSSSALRTSEGIRSTSSSRGGVSPGVRISGAALGAGVTIGIGAPFAGSSRSPERNEASSASLGHARAGSCLRPLSSLPRLTASRFSSRPIRSFFFRFLRGLRQAGLPSRPRRPGRSIPLSGCRLRGRGSPRPLSGG